MEVLFASDQFSKLDYFKSERKIYEDERVEIYQIVHENSKKMYIAKVFNVYPPEKDKLMTSYSRINTTNMMIGISRMMNVILKLNHPAILKFIGYCKNSFKNTENPMIITEFSSKGTLFQLFEQEYQGIRISDWNDTKKLINIYGIASAMSYLHSHDIIHCDLQPKHIFLDDFYFPKIGGFSSSKEISRPLYSELKGSSIYTAPEVYLYLDYSKASDVYSFAFILFEIISKERPFSEISNDIEIMKSVTYSNKRPELNDLIPPCYKKLIEKCWSNDPKERPTFDEIIFELKTNSEFITEKVDKESYFEYIQSINDSNISFKDSVKFDKFDNEIKERFFFKIYELKPNKKRKGNLYCDANNKAETNLDLNNFELGDLLTEKDQFYSFYEVVEKETSEKYVLKTPMYEMKNIFRADMINFIREMNIIVKLNHPSILKTIGYNHVGFKDHLNPVAVLDCDSLFGLSYYYEILTGAKFKDETNQLIFIYIIALGMAYLHAHGIIHRDLKISNVVIVKTKSNFYNDEGTIYPKITGFNLAKEVNENKINNENKIQGTPAYLAPEIITNQEYSKSSDVYAFSFIVYEIMTNRKPYKNDIYIQELFDKVKEGKRPAFEKPIGKAYRQLIEKCWSQDPKDRPTFDEIINELKNNPDFITENVDNEYFHTFVNYIDSYPNSFESDKTIEQLDYIMDNRIDTILDVDIHINSKPLNNIYETEMNNILLNCDCIDMRKFKFEDYLYKTGFHKISDVETGCHYLQKIFKIKDDLKKHEFVNFMNEFNIIRQLNHPSILKMIGYSPISNDKYNEGIIMVYESAENKSIENIILNETQKLIYIYGIATGMAYLHEHGIIHCDLKPSNIFLDDNNYPKITGLNIAKFIDKIKSSNENKIQGTPAYLAPEIITNQEYSKSSDVYAFSLIVYEIMTNEKPYDKNAPIAEVFKKVEEGERPSFKEHIGKAYRHLIKKCWSQNPSKRPTFDSIVKELKNNPDFITEKVDKAEFVKYIEMIDKSKISFESNKQINQLDDYINSKASILPEYGFDIISDGIYKTEMNNLFYDESVIDMTDFKSENNKQKDVRKRKLLFLYKKFVSKKTGLVYLGKQGDLVEISVEINRYKKIGQHNAILKYLGYGTRSNSAYILSEYAQYECLKNVLDLEKEGKHFKEWNDTKKLINLYGIASAMSYLNSIGIIHNRLSPDVIFLNEFLFPKLNDFTYSIDLSNQDCLVKKNTAFQRDDDFYIYEKPEFDESAKGDVYSFAIMAYEIITGDSPFDKNLSSLRVFQMKSDNFELEYKKPIIDCYKNLIEKGISEDPSKRPSFDEIVYDLRTNPDYLIDTVNKEEYFEYIKYIDGCFENQNFEEVDIEIDDNSNIPKLNFSINIKTLNLDNYRKIEKIGKGGFGVVYTVAEKETNNIYAAKVSLRVLDAYSNDLVLNLSREIDIISQLNHPAILKYIGYNPNNFKYKPKPTIVTELATNKSLDNVIELESMSCGIHEWDDTKKLINIYGIAAGMSYMHSKNILHRDLKTDNIFLDEFLYPKIGDFGLSKKISENSSDKEFVNPSGYKGTLSYSSPECALNCIYSKKGDVYSYGMIVYMIMVGKNPFQGLNQYQFLAKLCKGINLEFKYYIPHCYRSLIEDCTSIDPDKRPSFSEITKMIEENEEFVTENVDKIEFYDYISYIKENEDNHDSKLQKVSVDTSKIDGTNDENSFKDLFMNLNDYNKLKIVSKRDDSKIYKAQNKETNKLYLANISTNKIKSLSKEEAVNISKEANVISQLIHPSFLKFIGYSPTNFKNASRPVILTEFASNGSMSDVLKMERNYIPVPGWNDTKRLINIYGIASVMSYLHSHDIIHKNLKPENIFLDGYLFPKVGCFNLLSMYSKATNVTLQSMAKIKEPPVYSAPEVLQSNEYTKSSDVYAFSFIVYEILFKENSFKNLTFGQLFNEVVNSGNRPEIKKTVPDCYRKLIEKCWSQDPSERLAFDQIVEYLKTEPEFITGKVNKESYLLYIKYMDECKISIESTNKFIKFSEFIKQKENDANEDSSSNEEKSESESEGSNSNEVLNDASSKIDKIEEAWQPQNGMNHINETEQQMNKADKIEETSQSQISCKAEGADQASSGLTQVVKAVHSSDQNKIDEMMPSNPKEETLNGIENVNGNDKSLSVANKYKEIEQQSIDNDRIDETEESSNVISKIEETEESSNVTSKIEETEESSNVTSKIEETEESSNVTSKIEETEKSSNVTSKIEETEESSNVTSKIEETEKSSNVKSKIGEANESLNNANRIKDSPFINVESQKILAKKFSIENDAENTYKYMERLINSGNYLIPLDYAVSLFNNKEFKAAFNYFRLIERTNNPIARYFIGVMKYRGLGCEQNQKEAFQILKKLSDSGIDKASEFLEENFK